MQNKLNWDTRKCIILTLEVLSIVVLWGTSGYLTLPGILVAITGIVFTLKKRYKVVGVLFFTAFLGSFVGQIIFFFCLSCSVAAGLFLVAAIIALSINYRYATVMIAVVVAAVIIAIYASSLGISKIVRDKDLLYTSPYCSSCTVIVERLIAYDCMGNTWNPVIVPESAEQEGKKQLRMAGYKGIVRSGKSPMGVVPCIVRGENGEIVVGKSVLAYIKTL